jgi:hypothetical protein
MLARWWIELARRRRVRYARAVTKRPGVRYALDAQRRVDEDATAVVGRQSQLLVQRIGADPSRPDDGARKDALAVGEDCGMWLDGLERGVDANVDAAPRELPCGVVAEAAWDLREDLRGRIHQNPVLLLVAQGWVVAQRIAYEIRELAECLDPRIAGADEEEGQLTAPLPGTRRGSRGFEPAEDVVAQMDCIRKRLEAERVLGEARDGQRARDRAECDDEFAKVHGH